MGILYELIQAIQVKSEAIIREPKPFDISSYIKDLAGSDYLRSINRIDSSYPLKN